MAAEEPGPAGHRLIPAEECDELWRLAAVIEAAALLDLADYAAALDTEVLFGALAGLRHAGRRLRDEALLRLLALPVEQRPPAFRDATGLARAAGVGEQHVRRLEARGVGGLSEPDEAGEPDAPAGPT